MRIWKWLRWFLFEGGKKKESGLLLRVDFKTNQEADKMLVMIERKKVGNQKESSQVEILANNALPSPPPRPAAFPELTSARFSLARLDFL